MKDQETNCFVVWKDDLVDNFTFLRVDIKGFRYGNLYQEKEAKRKKENFATWLSLTDYMNLIVQK